MTTTTEQCQAMTAEEIRSLPAVSPAQPTVCAVWGISPATYYRLLAERRLPVPTFTVGRSRKVSRADVLRALQLTEAPASD